MHDAIPEPVFPEEDSYPAYRAPAPIAPLAKQKPARSAIDDYVLAAVVATGTVLVQPKFPRRITEL